MRNRAHVIVFIQGLPFKSKRLTIEKKIDQNPTPEEPVISFENLRKYINRRRNANEKTPKHQVR